MRLWLCAFSIAWLTAPADTKRTHKVRMLLSKPQLSFHTHGSASGCHPHKRPGRVLLGRPMQGQYLETKAGRGQSNPQHYSASKASAGLSRTMALNLGMCSARLLAGCSRSHRPPWMGNSRHQKLKMSGSICGTISTRFWKPQTLTVRGAHPQKYFAFAEISLISRHALL